MASCAPAIRPLTLRLRPHRINNRRLANSVQCLRQLSGTAIRRRDGQLENGNSPGSSPALEATLLGGAKPPSDPMAPTADEPSPQVLSAFEEFAKTADALPQYSYPRAALSEVTQRYHSAAVDDYLAKHSLPRTVENVRLATKTTARRLRRRGLHQADTIRSRVAKLMTSNLPFEELPYECFQEALKVLRADREEKVAKIVETRRKIGVLEARGFAEDEKAEKMRLKRLKSLEDYVGELEILADMNDPAVKRKFEDGTGMSSFTLNDHNSITKKALIDENHCRRPEETHLPLPKQAAVGRDGAQDNRAAHLSVPHCARHPALILAHNQHQDLLEEAKDPTWLNSTRCGHHNATHSSAASFR
jgi:hypothetical protein